MTLYPVNLSSQANSAPPSNVSFTTAGIVAIVTLGAAVALLAAYSQSQQQPAVFRRGGVRIKEDVNLNAGNGVPYSQDCIYKNGIYDCSNYYYH